MPKITLPYGENCILTAIPDACCVFSHWIDTRNPCKAYSASEQITVPVTDDVFFEAIFRPKIVNVSVILNHPELGVTSGSGKYKCGEEVTVSATTNACNDISWDAENIIQCQSQTSISINAENPCGNEKTISCTFTAYDNVAFLANITPSFVDVCVDTCPEDGGTGGVFQNLLTPFTNTFNGTPCLEQNTAIYECLDVYCGQPFMLLAKPNKGYVFLGWITSVDCDVCQDTQRYLSNENIYTTNACNDTNFIACFAKKDFFEINISGCNDINITYWLNNETEPRQYNAGFYINPDDTVHFTIKETNCCVISHVLNNGVKIDYDADHTYNVSNGTDTVIEIFTTSSCHAITMVKTGCEDSAYLRYKKDTDSTFTPYTAPITVLSYTTYVFEIDYSSINECKLDHWNVYSSGLPVQVSHLSTLTLTNIQRDYIIEAVMIPIV